MNNNWPTKCGYTLKACLCCNGSVSNTCFDLKAETALLDRNKTLVLNIGILFHALPGQREHGSPWSCLSTTRVNMEIFHMILFVLFWMKRNKISIFLFYFWSHTGGPSSNFIQSKAKCWWNARGMPPVNVPPLVRHSLGRWKEIFVTCT